MCLLLGHSANSLKELERDIKALAFFRLLHNSVHVAHISLEKTKCSFVLLYCRSCDQAKKKLYNKLPRRIFFSFWLPWKWNDTFHIADGTVQSTSRAVLPDTALCQVLWNCLSMVMALNFLLQFSAFIKTLVFWARHIVSALALWTFIYLLKKVFREWNTVSWNKGGISLVLLVLVLHSISMLNLLHTVKFSVRTVVMVLLGYTALTCD